MAGEEKKIIINKVYKKRDYNMSNKEVKVKISNVSKTYKGTTKDVHALDNVNLDIYKNGEIYFKTDDLELFEASLEYFKSSGFKEKIITYDLEKEPIFENNIETEHEKMFKNEGIKIKAGIFVRIA